MQLTVHPRVEHHPKELVKHIFFLLFQDYLKVAEPIVKIGPVELVLLEDSGEWKGGRSVSIRHDLQDREKNV